MPHSPGHLLQAVHPGFWGESGKGKQTVVSFPGWLGRKPESVPCDGGRMNAELCLSTGREPRTGAEKDRRGTEQEDRHEEKRKRNDMAVCLCL